MSQANAGNKIILAVDKSDPKEAADLINKVSPVVGSIKIGLEMIMTILLKVIGPADEKDAFENVHDIRSVLRPILGKIFLDTKLDDIPNTVGASSLVVSQLGVEIFNFHVSAGISAIEAAVKNRGKSKVHGVTVLTSIKEDECISIFGSTPDKKVLAFTRMLVHAGADGVICSPLEGRLIRERSEFDDIEVVTPGIRPLFAATGDQSRITTPGQAIEWGIDRLVIGRPITAPPKEIGTPIDAAKKIIKEIASKLAT